MRWLVLIALFLAAFPAAATAGHPGTPDPKAMVLQLNDLPAMFDREDGHYVSNTLLDEEAATHKDFEKLGRLTGYYTAYTAIALGGLTAVTSFVSIYKLGTGAHDSLVQSIAEAKQQGGLVLEPRTGLTRLGDDAHLYLQRVSQDGTKVDFFTLVWRRGHVFAEVMGAGVSGTVDPVQVIALAKKQDVHIDRILG
jgi:hypothetical protein